MNSVLPTPKIDLYADWIAHVRAELAGLGYQLPSETSAQDAVFAYYSFNLRAIRPLRRVVKRAAGLGEHAAGYEDVLDEIQRRAEKGELLLAYLSKRLADPSYNDPMLNDWGVHHLHLGRQRDTSGFIERTGPLLFAHVTRDAFYMLGVYGHGSWTDIGILEAILNNWPELLEQHEVAGLNISGPPITSDEHKRLRTKNGNTVVKLSNGKDYFPMGGGVASSGISINAVFFHDGWAAWLAKIQDWIVSHIEELERRLPQGLSFRHPPEFQMSVDERGLLVVEQGADYAFQFPGPSGLTCR